jgi:hypothetical protein
MLARKSSDLGDQMKDYREHTSRIAGTLTTAHDRGGHFAFGVAGIPLVDQHGALSDGSVVKDDRGAHVHQILKRVQSTVGRLFGTAGHRRLSYRNLQNSQSVEILTTHMSPICRAIENALR